MWKEDGTKGVPGTRHQEKVLVIDTLEKPGIEDLHQLFPDAEIIGTRAYQIHACVGCNSCWIKTPGKCAIRDDYEMIFQKILLADRVVFVAEEKLGMVTYRLKNIIDRMIAIDVPFTCICDGQARHAPRYDKRWKLMLLVPESERMEYLGKWMQRVAINFHSDSLGAYKISDKEGIEHALYHI